MAPHLPRGNQGNGVVFPSPVVMLSIIAVAMAAIAFVATRGGEPDEREVATPVRQESSPTASADPTPAEPTKTKKPRPEIKRDKVFVEVYNNSGITGLAGSVGSKATDVGWQVVGTDNWYGNIPTNTVYFPDRLKRAAKQLALDLGISRTAPADGAMKLDRLTVILTAELAATG
ncbi:LytR C-terminal domain-containing protein [Nocardioides sp.]|uniref:LytR C-terminal domain-containing protein n=1 Tax=Nocardioides sp. TaxID=35761 RepID=UPI000C900468|nr:LytR C-terminal domain-containing protein [Nocardioides sp.]MAS54966.1 hypothetical protein [Pimelobacter sp.]MDE0775193.1 LytR C-terminal domain-containing protein [Nocardioides sp.]